MSGRPMRWRNLTPRERAEIANGCGAKGSWVPIPDFMHTASCNHHDLNYWIGGTEADRRKADWQFYQALLEDVQRLAWWRRPAAAVRAWVYYQAVRIWGRGSFHYGEPRGWPELWEELGR